MNSKILYTWMRRGASPFDRIGIAARVINEDGFDNVLWLGIGLFAASLVLIMAPLRKHSALRGSPAPDIA